MGVFLSTRNSILVVVAVLGSLGIAQLARASEDGAEDGEDSSSVVVREPAVESVGVHAVPEGAEERISEDVRKKVGSRGDLLASCYARYATEGPEPEAVISVDWTITTSGEAIEFSVFTRVDSFESCIRRTLSGLQFAHLDDRHPRARVRLRFR